MLTWKSLFSDPRSQQRASETIRNQSIEAGASQGFTRPEKWKLAHCSIWSIFKLYMATLTKREIVVNISTETGLVQHDVFNVVQRTLDHIVAALAKGDNVELRNFGVFEVKLTKPRVGRNPNEPGSSFVIPARATVKFKSGKVMKEKVAALTEKLKSEGA